MKKKRTNIILVIILIAGLVILLYPSVSNWWNSGRQTRVVADYINAVDELSPGDCEDMISDAEEYNRSLRSKGDRYELGSSDEKEYAALLNIDGNGAMGYIEIPKISVTMPIYHTTEADVLQFAAGHIPGTSLPVGGIGTHCVISGHRGLPSAKLFTDLDKVQTGDIFRVTVLNKSLSYEVDRIRIVEPEDMEALEIDRNADLFTLVTCTPYGVNTHRLLVRGHRISEEGAADEVFFSSEAVRIEPVVVMPFVFIILLLIFLFVAKICKKAKTGSSSKRRQKKGNSREATD